MSPKLKPLLLPQLVQQRRKQEEADQVSSFYLADHGSSSEFPSPVTPTFSHRGGHARYSSSTSSLDLSASYCSESPLSPALLANPPAPPAVSPTASSPVANGTLTKSPTPKRSLPDVQEEPIERECGNTLLVDALEYAESFDEDIYCLCNQACEHRRPRLPQAESFPATDEYDCGFISDSEFNGNPFETIKKHRGRGRSNGESPLSGLASRIRLPSLSRWRSAERRGTTSSLSFTTSEITLDHRPSLSISPSSRSSSISRGRRPTLDRTNEPPTPALSFYESSDSIPLPTPLDVEAANSAGKSLERDRAMATTPLLPPLMTQLPPSVSPSVPQSPLEFPKMEPTFPLQQLAMGYPEMSVGSPQFFPSPAPSSKPSISSFRHAAGPSLSLPPAATSELPSPLYTNFSLDLQQPDSWSDRLGHANFTILPKPYVPAEADLAVLQILRADWNQARINFTKHLVRTGEHYGATSKTYLLTEAKWAEVEQEWRAAHDNVVDRFAAICNGNGDTSEALRWRHQQEDVSVPSTVPRILDADKFPDLGDEDIVGPMVRDVSRDLSPTRASRFWRSLAGKVGLKK